MTGRKLLVVFHGPMAFFEYNDGIMVQIADLSAPAQSQDLHVYLVGEWLCERHLASDKYALKGVMNGAHRFDQTLSLYVNGYPPAQTAVATGSLYAVLRFPTPSYIHSILSVPFANYQFVQGMGVGTQPTRVAGMQIFEYHVNPGQVPTLAPSKWQMSADTSFATLHIIGQGPADLGDVGNAAHIVHAWNATANLVQALNAELTALDGSHLDVSVPPSLTLPELYDLHMRNNALAGLGDATRRVQVDPSLKAGDEYAKQWPDAPAKLGATMTAPGCHGGIVSHLSGLMPN